MKTNMIILHNDFDEGAEDYDIIQFSKEYEFEDIKEVVKNFEDKCRNTDLPEEEYCWDNLIELLEEKFGEVEIINLVHNAITIEW